MIKPLPSELVVTPYGVDNDQDPNRFGSGFSDEKFLTRIQHVSGKPIETELAYHCLSKEGEYGATIDGLIETRGGVIMTIADPIQMSAQLGTKSFCRQGDGSAEEHQHGSKALLLQAMGCDHGTAATAVYPVKPIFQDAVATMEQADEKSQFPLEYSRITAHLAGNLDITELYCTTVLSGFRHKGYYRASAPNLAATLDSAHELRRKVVQWSAGQLLKMSDRQLGHYRFGEAGGTLRSVQFASP